MPLRIIETQNSENPILEFPMILSSKSFVNCMEQGHHELSISVNLWRKCPRACNFAMGHVVYNDDRSQPLPMRRLRLQAFVCSPKHSITL